MDTKIAIGIVVVLAVAGAAYYLYARPQQAMAPGATGNTGEYAYVCDDGSQFSMTPAPDLSSVTIFPGTGTTFAETALLPKESSAGARFEGGGIVFVGAGEEVQLTVGATTRICNPQPNPDNAPFNWGDAGEGPGSVKQDVTLIVGESIVGKWKSVEDPRFIREFKEDGTAVDYYNDEVAARGTWKVYTKERPLSVSFPLEGNAVYVQMTMSGSQDEKFNFKVAKLTPEGLDLVYMERGGATSFVSVP